MKLLAFCACGCGTVIPGTKAYARANNCHGCGRAFAERHLFLGQVDESNRSITLNSGYWCATCHAAKDKSFSSPTR